MTDDTVMTEAEIEEFRRRYQTMSPLEAKLELLLRQSVRLGYVGKESLGLQRLFNTIDAFIAGTRDGWDNCSSARTASNKAIEMQMYKVTFHAPAVGQIVDLGEVVGVCAFPGLCETL